MHPNEQKVIDTINELETQDFYIGVEFDGELKTTLPRKRVLAKFEELLKKYTREEVLEITERGRMYDAPSATITCGDWTAQGWLVPIAEPEIGTHRSRIVMYPFTAARTDVEGSVRTAIDRKRTRYGQLDAPFVIAVNVRDSYYNGIDNDMGILLGDQVIRYSSSDPDVPGVLGRKNNGIWYRQRKVDAVMICSRFDIWNLRNATARLYVNPRSDKSELPENLLQFPHAEWTDGQINWHAGDNIPRFVGLR